MAGTKRGHRASTVHLAPGAVDKLTDMAAARGMFVTNGAGAGKLGSMSQLMNAIARGEYLLAPPEVVALLQRAYDLALPHEPGRAEVGAALRLLGHDPDPEVETHYTPPSVVDAVAGSGAYLARITAAITGNPPAGGEEEAQA